MRVEPIFRDRRDAGKALAALLAHSAGDPNLLVLALPRGGVPVAFEVARALRAPLDIFLVRKLGLPGQEELAIGAIASGEGRVLNELLIADLDVPRSVIDEITARERQELERREALYRGTKPSIPVRGRAVILVDDGLATGASMRAAAKALRPQMPKRITVAVPVAAQQTCDEIRADVDAVVCAYTPEPFVAIGTWYEDFSQTTDEEVQSLLTQAALRDSSAA